MEIGPRALGHRSILADPRLAENHHRVNDIKGREQWRPLAPSILATAADDVLDAPGPAPFMLTACPVRPRVRERIPAVVHVDGSCRPQLVRPEANQRYARMLCRLGELGDTPVVLNTSFNVAGEPLVCSPHDAVRAFFTSELDALVIGSSIMRKDGRIHD
jgi:carbamoyltransferase